MIHNYQEISSDSDAITSLKNVMFQTNYDHVLIRQERIDLIGFPGNKQAAGHITSSSIFPWKQQLTKSQMLFNTRTKYRISFNNHLPLNRCIFE